MSLRSLAPEASASANSATWAGVRGRENMQLSECQQALVATSPQFMVTEL